MHFTLFFSSKKEKILYLTTKLFYSFFAVATTLLF